MATGDMKNNLRKLRTELRAINYKIDIDWEKINIGLTEHFLPILHFTLAEYSCLFSSYLSSHGYDFYGKSDLRFLEVLYKLLIQEFSVKPMLTKEQFFSVGFAEIKTIFVTKVISLCRSKNIELTKEYGTKKKKRSSGYSLKKSGSSDRNAIEERMLGKTSVPEPYPIPQMTISEVTRESADILDVTELDEDEEDYSGSNYTDSLGCENNTFPESHAELLDDSVENVPDFVVTKHNDGGKHVNVAERNELDYYYSKPSEESFKIKPDVHVDNSDGVGDRQNKQAHKPITGSNKIKQNKNIKQGIITPKNQQGHEPKHVKESNKRRHRSIKEQDISQSELGHCESCDRYKDITEIFERRLFDLEKKMTEVYTVNSELSAKVVILETKLNFLEGNNNTQSEVTENNNSMQAKVHQEELDCSNNHDVKSSSSKKKEPSHIEDTYSPIKYTGDDVILENFKPITMQDVLKSYSNMEISTGEANRDSPTIARTTGVDLRSVDENTKSIFDDSTTNTVKNVRQYLKDTQLILARHNGMKRNSVYSI